MLTRFNLFTSLVCLLTLGAVPMLLGLNPGHQAWQQADLPTEPAVPVHTLSPRALSGSETAKS